MLKVCCDGNSCDSEVILSSEVMHSMPIGWVSLNWSEELPPLNDVEFDPQLAHAQAIGQSLKAMLPDEASKPFLKIIEAAKISQELERLKRPPIINNKSAKYLSKMFS